MKFLSKFQSNLHLDFLIFIYFPENKNFKIEKMSEPTVPLSLYEAKIKELGQIKEKLKNINYYQYCNVVRNEISKYDKYAWSSGFSYAPFKEDLDYIKNWEDLQEEKRKMRLIHALNNSTDDEILQLSRKLPADMRIESFYAHLARAYRIISEEIHTLFYNIYFSGFYCPKITRNKTINVCINLLMENVEFNVGEMVPVDKKIKFEESSGESGQD